MTGQEYYQELRRRAKALGVTSKGKKRPELESDLVAAGGALPSPPDPPKEPKSSKSSKSSKEPTDKMVLSETESKKSTDKTKSSTKRTSSKRTQTDGKGGTTITVVTRTITKKQRRKRKRDMLNQLAFPGV